ncbi:hypothetical protein EDD90_1426 [Streptomyces sp. Ag109_O5-1]|uniref:hypothetical protein n=1 Tax=Streptomyces sp. Ag109_O5-1 TaxID=1938851 RepID=UPI000F4EB830|nr:hypothetical protein [Streptomyces sp. Ag109_O5-1]RPE38527.1 hypothetical protein EDD90_1426 [Streptomyces sp. Ag109_O5-1]
MENLIDVTSMHVPVRDATGQVVLALHLIGFTGHETPGRLHACLDRLRSGGRSADALLSRSTRAGESLINGG